MLLVIISLIVFLTYLVGTYIYFGIPASISDTYYKLERRKKGLGLLFTAFCWSVAFMLLPGWLDLTPETFQFTCFWAAAGLLFVGAAPLFKLQKSIEQKVHFGGAIVCLLFSQAWVICCGMWWVTLLSFAICLYLAYRDRKWMFWIEIAAFTATYIGIFIK